MQLRPDQLSAALGSALKPVYLVSGDEPLQVMEASDAIRTAARAQGYAEREVLDVDNHFEWQNFLDAAATLSLFAQQRIIELRIPSAKPGRTGSDAIKCYLDQPADDTLLLITTGKLEAASKNTAWFKAIDKLGVVVQCWPIGVDKLPGWIKTRFNMRAMQVDDTVASFVSQHVEGNLLAAVQEIEKLYLLLGPGPVTLANVREALTQSSRFTVFELTDAALQGNRARVLKVLAALDGEGVVPVVINFSLAREIRLLTMAMQDATTAELQLRRAGVWDARLPLYRDCMRRHSPRALQSMLQRCALIVRASKGADDANPWDELRGLCFRLAGRTLAKGNS